jgi:hypothetical protein
MKKKPFLLLEVLLAFFLIALCLVPLVKYPLQFYKTEMHELEMVELERLADLTFTEIKEKFLKGEVSWEEIPAKGELAGPFPLSHTELLIPGREKKRVNRRFYLHVKGEKEGIQKQVYKQIWIYLLLNGEQFCYRMPVQKIPIE